MNPHGLADNVVFSSILVLRSRFTISKGFRPEEGYLPLQSFVLLAVWCSVRVQFLYTETKQCQRSR